MSLPRFPLGHVTFWVERTRGRIAWVGTFSSLAAAVKLYDLSWWWVAALIPLAAVSILIDRRHIYPGEAEAATRKNPEWNRMMKKIGDVEKLINEKL